MDIDKFAKPPKIFRRQAVHSTQCLVGARAPGSWTPRAQWSVWEVKTSLSGPIPQKSYSTVAQIAVMVNVGYDRKVSEQTVHRSYLW